MENYFISRYFKFNLKSVWNCSLPKISSRAMTTQNLFPRSNHSDWHEQLDPSLILVPELVQKLIRPNQLLIREKVAFFCHEKTFPMLEVCFDGSHYWLMKDLESLLAIQQAQPTEILVQVTKGDAYQAAISLVKSMALAFSHRERYRKSVANKLLSDPEWLKLEQQHLKFHGEAATSLMQVCRQTLYAQSTAQLYNLRDQNQGQETLSPINNSQSGLSPEQSPEPYPKPSPKLSSDMSVV
jgi:hypothetical protein